MVTAEKLLDMRDPQSGLFMAAAGELGGSMPRGWCSFSEMAMLKAFSDIFHPQANLCSCGADL